jgi:hypothetical protein
MAAWKIEEITNEWYREDCLKNNKKDMDPAIAEKIIKEEWMQHLIVLNKLFSREDCFISEESVFLSEVAYNLLMANGFPKETSGQVETNLRKELFSHYHKYKERELNAERKAKNTEGFFRITLSKFYSDKEVEEKERLEILERVLLKEDMVKSDDPDTIEVSVLGFKLLKFLRKCPVDVFEKTLKEILPSEYHEWKQVETQKREASSDPSGGLAQSSQLLVEIESKKEEESSPRSIPPASDMSFFSPSTPTIPLERVSEILNEISTLDGSSLPKNKLIKGSKPHLFMECKGVEVEKLAWSLQECFVDAKTWGKEYGYSFLAVYGLTDQTKFLQEGTQKTLRELFSKGQSPISIPKGPG